jgi:hypothetical protein
MKRPRISSIELAQIITLGFSGKHEAMISASGKVLHVVHQTARASSFS